MASNDSEPRPAQPGSLQSMLARLRGMVQALKATEQEDQARQELLPTWDASGASPVMPGAVADALPSADAKAELDANVAGAPPLAEAASPAVVQPPDAAAAMPVAGSAVPDASGAEPCAPEDADALTPQAEPSAPTSTPEVCPYCKAPRSGAEPYCDNCGWIFPLVAAVPPPPPSQSARPRLHNRYELSERLGERENVARYRGLDYGTGSTDAIPVILLRSALPESIEALAHAESPIAAPAESAASSEIVPTLDELTTAFPEAEAVPLQPVWPSIAWERSLLERLQHPLLPRVIDAFAEGGFEYLVEELPTGQPLWDAWDDPAITADQRFGWLKQIAGVLFHLHQSNAILEALRPEIIVLTPEGQPRLTDIADLLPLPLPPHPPIRATYYTAPELVLASDKTDARASVYSFGAMLYALHLGRELTELDFELQGVPKAFLERFPDAHPLFGRLVSKTFCRDLTCRFPTEEAAKEDPSGFAELIHTLEICRQNLDRVRLEIAAWTTTGMVRNGNEDAFALLHASEARENEMDEAALVLLADGMGGYEAGEVAATMAVRALRSSLVKQKPFAALGGDPVISLANDDQGGSLNRGLDVETCKGLLAAALQDANRRVYTAAHSGLGRPGMGCTAEVVYVDGRHVVVGHVGDSRTYYRHEGRLIQLTCDQTWVNRMVELGALTPQEAGEHPRRSELQQAIGGRPDVEPALYHGTLKPGDWVVVCSDGLSNHISLDTLTEMLQSAPSAEWAARRLVNFVNLAGATDNATVVVIRAK